MLLIHGLEDRYVLADALSGTWDWLERDLTLVTVPGAGHFVHRDVADFVTDTILRWLGGTGGNQYSVVSRRSRFRRPA